MKDLIKFKRSLIKQFPFQLHFFSAAYLRETNFHGSSIRCETILSRLTYLTLRLTEVGVKNLDFNTAVQFHGHICPGLSIGYRVAVLAADHFKDRSKDEELVAIAENRSCAVDAIQAINGCTCGKGNLICNYSASPKPVG